MGINDYNFLSEESVPEFGLEEDPGYSLMGAEEASPVAADPLSLVSSNLGIESPSDFASRAAQLRALENQYRQEAADLLQKSQENRYGPDIEQLTGQALAAFLPALIGYAAKGKKLGSQGAEIGMKLSAGMQEEQKKEAARQQALDAAGYKEKDALSKAASQQAQQVEMEGGRQRFREEQAKENRAWRETEAEKTRAFMDATRANNQAFQAALLAQRQDFTAERDNRPVNPVIAGQVSKMTGLPEQTLASMTNKEVEAIVKNAAEERRQRSLQFETRRAENAVINDKLKLANLEIKTPDPKILDSLSAYKPLSSLTAQVIDAQGDRTRFLVAAQRLIPAISPDVQSMDLLADYVGRQIRSLIENGVATDQDVAAFRDQIRRTATDTTESYLDRASTVLKNLDDTVKNKIRYRVNVGLEDLEPIAVEFGIGGLSVKSAAEKAYQRRMGQPLPSFNAYANPSATPSTPSSENRAAEIARLRQEVARKKALLKQARGE